MFSNLYVWQMKRIKTTALLPAYKQITAVMSGLYQVKECRAPALGIGSAHIINVISFFTYGCII